MKKGTITYQLAEIEVAAKLIIQFMASVSRFAFTGHLGSGKTTLIKKILQLSGIECSVQSPTFSYISTYTGYSGIQYHHFDLYRLTNYSQFLEMGFMEYLEEPTSYTFIEWPDIVSSLLTVNVCFIALEYVNENTRVLHYEIIDHF